MPLDCTHLPKLIDIQVFHLVCDSITGRDSIFDSISQKTKLLREIWEATMVFESLNIFFWYTSFGVLVSESGLDAQIDGCLSKIPCIMRHQAFLFHAREPLIAFQIYIHYIYTILFFKTSGREFNWPCRIIYKEKCPCHSGSLDATTSMLAQLLSCTVCWLTCTEHTEFQCTCSAKLWDCIPAQRCQFFLLRTCLEFSNLMARTEKDEDW